jgi:hypothetical protein
MKLLKIPVIETDIMKFTIYYDDFVIIGTPLQERESKQSIG